MTIITLGSLHLVGSCLVFAMLLRPRQRTFRQMGGARLSQFVKAPTGANYASSSKFVSDSTLWTCT